MTLQASHEGALPGRPALRPALRQVFSLSGLVPLGVFLLVHVVINARALRGQAAFEGASRMLEALPAVRLVEVVFVYVPLVVHAAIGLWLTVTRARPAPPSPYPPRVAQAMRVTGVMVLLFVAVHVLEMRSLGAGPRPPPGAWLTILSADLSSTSYGVPWNGIGYLVGTAATTLHFVVGAWGWLLRTRHGMVASTRRRAAWAACAVGLAIWILFADIVVLHATGTRLLGSVAPPATSRQPCPPPSGSGP